MSASILGIYEELIKDEKLLEDGTGYKRYRELVSKRYGNKLDKVLNKLGMLKENEIIVTSTVNYDKPSLNGNRSWYVWETITQREKNKDA